MNRSNAAPGTPPEVQHAERAPDLPPGVDPGRLRAIGRTRSVCPACLEEVDAEIATDEIDVYIDRTCRTHGRALNLLWRNVGRYRKVMSLVSPVPPGQVVRGTSLREFPEVRGVNLDVTTRCNLLCPSCFTDANNVPAMEADPETVRRMLGEAPTKSSVVFLMGGEPTLNPRLPEIIRTVVGLGFVPKLITNGLKLSSLAYIRELRDAGLRWVFLQFDGFREETSLALRGRDLRRRKEEAIEALSEEGLQILLACMIVPGVNDQEIGRIVRYGMEHRAIRQVALLPVSDVGRDRGEARGREMFMEDVFRALEEQTQGQVGGDDFLAFLSAYSKIFRLTGIPSFKPKSCNLSLLLTTDAAGRLVPLNRLLAPFGALSAPRAAARAARAVATCLSYDRWESKKGMLMLNIEKFRSVHNLDLVDTLRGSKVYLTPEGFTYACAYNNLYRTKRSGPGVGPRPC